MAICVVCIDASYIYLEREKGVCMQCKRGRPEENEMQKRKYMH